MMDAIEALRRLEEAGKASARATRRLREAATVLAASVRTAVPEELHGHTLPRGYRVVRRNTGAGPATFLCRGDIDREYIDGPADGPGRYVAPPASRAAIVAFARDVADGWLEELSAHLEACALEDASASEGLESATKDIAKGRRWPGPCLAGRYT
jgi:hypothetical protein